jgi:hypothetical protein
VLHLGFFSFSPISLFLFSPLNLGLLSFWSLKFEFDPYIMNLVDVFPEFRFVINIDLLSYIH